MKSKAGQGVPKACKGQVVRCRSRRVAAKRRKICLLVMHGLDAPLGSVDFDRKIFKMCGDKRLSKLQLSRLPMAERSQLSETPQDERRLSEAVVYHLHDSCAAM
jgi:hypothetical protein